jgi:hypothetical protein
VLLLDCTRAGTDPSPTLGPKSPTTGERATEVEVEGAADATVMAWWPHNIKSIFLSSCCVRSRLKRRQARGVSFYARLEIGDLLLDPLIHHLEARINGGNDLGLDCNDWGVDDHGWRGS